jgi:hypothetical protein
MNYCLKNSKQQQRMIRRRSSPYSCVDSFFPTGDPVKDMLTLKNTLFNAQIRASAASRLDTDSHLRPTIESELLSTKGGATGGGNSTEESTNSTESLQQDPGCLLQSHEDSTLKGKVH